jgi:hypothetical protein
MRIRPLAALAAAAAVAAAVPAHAASPTLDGKKTKVLTFKDTVTAPADNDADYAGLTSSDRTQCTPPRCSKFTFLYKPAKGVKKGPFSVRITWSAPAEDYDLYVVQDNAGIVGQCGAAVGTSETVVVPAPAPGHRYTIVVDHYRTVPDTVVATASFPAKDKVATTVPKTVDDNVQTVNCGIS